MNGGYSDKNMKKICDKVEKWYALFSKSKQFEELTPEQKYESDFIITSFTEYMYTYHLLTPEGWDEECLEDCCTEILPRKISAEESYFRSVAPVLSAFFSFAEEKRLLRNASNLAKKVKEFDKQIIENAADPNNWGMAKSFVMAAMEAGVDITDEEEMRKSYRNILQKLERYERTMSKPSPKIGRNDPTEEDEYGIHVIKPTSFYSNESEKIKLNWFCYELSMGLYDEIRESLGKRLEKYKIDDKAIADFSIYISKRMKDIILQQLSGKIETVYFSYEMVESYFPNLSDRLVNKMLDAFSKVWDEQLSVCGICPTRCISEKDAYCTMFDEEPY